MTLNAKLFEKLKKRKENGGKVSRKKNSLYLQIWCALYESY